MVINMWLHVDHTYLDCKGDLWLWVWQHISMTSADCQVAEHNKWYAPLGH